MNVWKRLLCFLSALLLLLHSMPVIAASSSNTADPLGLHCQSAILLESSTGTILYEKDGHTPLPMASVTKIMTLYLIFEALARGDFAPDSDVTISEHAASMGGSQVFLGPGEIQSVETLIKCISIASANDAAVAMAEKVSGSEEQFVSRMNDTAQKMHLEHTHFINCCGLDAEDHVSCAVDLALLTRELTLRYPCIFDYCQIWQEDMIHTTRKGQTPFTLTNTNKLLKTYPYATGLKTGSTSAAKFCLSATAQKDNIQLIAVIMAAPSSKERIKDAQTLFEFGFENTSVYRHSSTENTYDIPVTKGIKESIHAAPSQDFTYLDQKKTDLSGIRTKISLPESLMAPIKKGTAVGSLDYYLGDTKLGSVPILTTEACEKTTFSHTIQNLIHQFTLSPKNAGR